MSDDNTPQIDPGFLALVQDAHIEARTAMRRFPQPNYVISKIAEESGEVIKAAIHCAEGRETPKAVAGEMRQLIAMLFRLWVEGDQVHGLAPIRPRPSAQGDSVPNVVDSQLRGLEAGRAGAARMAPPEEPEPTWWLLGWDQAHIERNEGEPFGWPPAAPATVCDPPPLDVARKRIEAGEPLILCATCGRFAFADAFGRPGMPCVEAK